MYVHETNNGAEKNRSKKVNVMKIFLLKFHKEHEINGEPVRTGILASKPRGIEDKHLLELDIPSVESLNDFLRIRETEKRNYPYQYELHPEHDSTIILESKTEIPWDMWIKLMTKGDKELLVKMVLEYGLRKTVFSRTIFEGPLFPDEEHKITFDEIEEIVERLNEGILLKV